MKSPLRSRRAWAGVWAVATVVWALLPPEWTQGILDAKAYVLGRVSLEQLNMAGAAVLAIWGDDERIDWRKLLPGGDK